MIGQYIGHYRIAEKLGQGGMGVVYRALDERLEREVALKVVSPGLLTQGERQRSFRKEALALSKLNHPNIAAVYDFDALEQVDFLVMEYVPGLTLTEKLNQGHLAEKEILRLGLQLAEGIEAAHRQGVVHRDLKPGNLRITPEGRLKILDFGLARLLRPPTDSQSTEPVESVHNPAGTLPYIAPERFRDSQSDGRADIYAAGAILYEMATGRRIFGEMDTPKLLNSILNEMPVTPRALNHHVSPELEGIILKALDKDPDRRYQSARELAIDLERLASPGAVPVAVLPRRGWRWGLISGAALGLAAVLAVAFLLRPRAAQTGTPVMVPLLSSLGGETNCRLSPNNKWYSCVSGQGSRQAILLRPVAGGPSQPVYTHEGSVSSHLWSPDGKSIAFLLATDEETLLQIMPSFGGPVEHSARLDRPFASGRLIRWIGSDLYIGVSQEGLWRFNLATNRMEHLVPGREESGLRGEFDICEGRNRLVYSTLRGLHRTLWESDLRGGGARRLTPGDHTAFLPRWMGTSCDSVVYSSERAGGTDLWRLSVAGGAPTRITFSSGSEMVEDTAADGSLLIFQESTSQANLWQIQTRGADSQGRRLTAGLVEDSWPNVSTGTIIYQRAKQAPGQGSDIFDARIFRADLESFDPDQATLLRDDGGAPLLSPDGRWLTFVKHAPGQKGYELWIQEMRSGHAWRLTRRFNISRLYPFPTDWVDVDRSWTPDSRRLFFAALSDAGTQEIYRIDPSEPGASPAVVASAPEPAWMNDLSISPDGRLLAYTLSSMENPAASELHVLDLPSAADRTVTRYAPAQAGQLFCRGWLGPDGPLLLLRTQVNADWTDRTEILRMDLSGREKIVTSLEHALAGSARLAPDATMLYLVRTDDEGPAHNLYSVRLADGALRRLTKNSLPGVSFAGFQALPDGRLFYSEQLRNEGVWLIRFDH